MWWAPVVDSPNHRDTHTPREKYNNVSDKGIVVKRLSTVQTTEGGVTLHL